MLTRVAAATVAGGIVFFLLGFVIFGLLLEPMAMKPNMITYAGLAKEPPEWIFIILANLVNAFFLAYIFDKWATISTFLGGVKGGATVAFLVALTNQLMFMAFLNISRNYVPAVADIVGSTVMGAIGGGVIGAVLGFMNKNKAN